LIPGPSEARTKDGGLYFEQFSVGQTFVHEIRRTVTDHGQYSVLGVDVYPAAVHIDHEYAKSTEFGKPLMNSFSRSV